jgi:hypothetical protein
MTWYADEIFAPASAEVLHAIRADALLAPFSYLLSEPFDFEWHRAEVAHGFPKPGLLVIQPVCGADPDEYKTRWYREPILDWHSFSERSNLPLEIDPKRVGEECSLNIETLPPRALLGHLKHLATETRRPFAFYSCAMWGGDVEVQYAWVFGPSELALVSLSPSIPGGPRPVAVVTPSEPAQIVTGDTLVLTLRHLSLDLPTPFFAPHTRSFPWARYKLVGDPP